MGVKMKVGDRVVFRAPQDPECGYRLASWPAGAWIEPGASYPGTVESASAVIALDNGARVEVRFPVDCRVEKMP